MTTDAMTYPTELEAIYCARNLFEAYYKTEAPLAVKTTGVTYDFIANMGVAYFDISYPNGKVYRIRVSDITPERVTP